MILVVDLEATCANDGSIPAEGMEIIEIGACWADIKGNVIDRFQTFVHPLEHARLTPFCVELTGIQQAQIDAAPMFPLAADALREFADRYREPHTFWTSWGAYDRKQISRDCERHSIAGPLEMEHRSAKRLFAKVQRIGKEVGMAKALELAGLLLEGEHHRALDDACNIARLLPWVLGDRLLRGISK